MPFVQDGSADTPVRETGGFLHCRRCFNEWSAEGKPFSPRARAELQVNFDGRSFQVSCRKHNVNVMLVELVDQYPYEVPEDAVQMIEDVLYDKDQDADRAALRQSARWLYEEFGYRGYELVRKDSTENSHVD